MRFDTLLIANRGEIALRVMRTAARMGLRTVAVYSDADRGALHVREADVAVRIGPADSRSSYGNIDAVVAACAKSGAQAVHPGYGFLSENAEFAQAVVDAGLTFVGPRPDVIALMGNKARAKRTMQEAGVPTVPGAQGWQDMAGLLAAARRIGFPVILKATAGGGGRGMRVARDERMLMEVLPLARSEALGAFGSDELILEKAIESARHVEIQVLCDEHGRCVHLGERDCSMQRRYQKIIEECPSPAVSDALRVDMGAVAVKACQAIGYSSVGTLEFLLGGDGAFYFMEMNTRLQVEHGVTELVTGLDLVEHQLRVAQGEALALEQDDIRFSGHAIELRLCAEDPAAGFVPQVGHVDAWQAPPDIRVDAALHGDMNVSPFYDSMLAKFLAAAPSRAECIRKLTMACERTTLLGIRSNLKFLERCINHPVFLKGEATTAFLSNEDLRAAHWQPRPSVFAQAAGVLALSGVSSVSHGDSRCAAGLFPAFELVMSDPGRTDSEEGAASVCRVRPTALDTYRIAIEAQAVQTEFDVSDIRFESGRLALVIDGVRRTLTLSQSDADTAWVQDGACAWTYRRVTRFGSANGSAQSGQASVRAPMSGRVISVAVRPGEQVTAQQTLVVLESMKMEMSIAAGADGTVSQLNVAPGDQVSTGRILVEIRR